MTLVASYQKISPTAKLVAEMRRHSDIPFAEQIAQSIGTSEMVRAMLGGEPFSNEVLQLMAPLAEARYKSLLLAIKKSGVKQVIELASGFSFRGAVMTSDPSMKYIETDLPESHEERVELRRLLETEGNLRPRPNLMFAPVNVISPTEMAGLAAHLAPGQPVAIVNEGLFQYFSMDEKKAAALNIFSLLKKFGGIWLTPDLDVKEDAGIQKMWTHPQLVKVMTFIMSQTERNLMTSAFENVAQVKKFFSDLGFEITSAPQIDGSFHLSSVERVGNSPEQLEALKKSRLLWTLSAKQ
jgi:O-methyltransferase involved in polyketide biosynthesis